MYVKNFPETHQQLFGTQCADLRGLFMCLPCHGSPEHHTWTKEVGLTCCTERTCSHLPFVRMYILSVLFFTVAQLLPPNTSQLMATTA